ncbi:hypothetical protein ACWC2H_13625 [Streptomyces sp. 900105755]
MHPQGIRHHQAPPVQDLQTTAALGLGLGPAFLAAFFAALVEHLKTVSVG